MGNVTAAVGHVITLNDEKLLRWFFASRESPPTWDESSSGLEDYFKNEQERTCNEDWNADIIRWVQQSETVLETAALYSTPAVINFLLARGASLHNSYALHAAIISIDPKRITSDRIAMMDHLVKLGADIYAIANYHGAFQGQGRTPFHAAASHGRVEEAKWLYEHGADIMKKNRFGNLPSVECRFHDNLVMRELYLEWELEASDNRYSSPLPASLDHLLA